jgi:hypothetical protein
VPLICRKVGPRRLGPLGRPFASAPWQRTQVAAWKIESPNATIAGVTAADDEGAGVAAAVVAGREVGDAAGAGAEVVVEEPPPELQAAIAAAATMNSVGRTKRL